MKRITFSESCAVELRVVNIFLKSKYQSRKISKRQIKTENEKFQ